VNPKEVSLNSRQSPTGTQVVQTSNADLSSHPISLQLRLRQWRRCKQPEGAPYTTRLKYTACDVVQELRWIVSITFAINVCLHHDVFPVRSGPIEAISSKYRSRKSLE